MFEISSISLRNNARSPFHYYLQCYIQCHYSNIIRQCFYLAVTTLRYCDEVEGMSNPQILPDENIDVPNGSPADLRPGDDTPWTSLPDDDTPVVTITLADDGEPEIQLGSFNLPQDTLYNVHGFTLYLVDENGIQTPYNPQSSTSTSPQVNETVPYTNN